MIPFDEKIKKLSRILPEPLYAVGGYVRNFLIDGTISEDVDLAGVTDVEEMLPFLKKCRLKVVAEYKRTGTFVFFDGKKKYEYAQFRKEIYPEGGFHTPDYTEKVFTPKEDALRRDFKCNAVYYDIKNGVIVDPLDGLKDIRNKILDTVCDANEVFSHDGLRLMRLARFAGELSFVPTKKVVLAARDNADKIKDIAPERIFSELKGILASGKKYRFSDGQGSYIGLKILDDTRVLDYIFPELTLGRGMAQRSDYHSHDVLEHSLRTALYAEEDVKLYALLHDIGKPFCMLRDGRYRMHGVEGKRLVKDALKRLKADNKTIKTAQFITENHMLDMEENVRESNLRRFFVKNYALLPPLMKVCQADFSGSKDNLSKAPTVKRWEKLLSVMKEDGTPFSVADLKIGAEDIISLGGEGKKIGEIMNVLFDECVIEPQKNNAEKLKKRAENLLKQG